MNIFGQLAIFALLLGLLGYKDWQAMKQIEQRVAAQVAAKTSQLELEYSNKIADINKDHLLSLQEASKEANTRYQEYEYQILEWRDKAEKLAIADPKTFGDDYGVRLARIMCRIGAGTDKTDGETCDNAPAEAFTADVATTITVTAETAEIWEELCEEGKRDFCEWSVTGFTPEMGERILSYMVQLDAYVYSQGMTIDAVYDLIDAINNDQSGTLPDQ